MTTSAIELLPERPCGIAAALDIVGDRWSLLMVREVWRNNRRFSGIVEVTGAPRDRVAARLKLLVSTGVLERQQYQEAPARYEYVLTPAGLELATILVSLFDWGVRWGHVREGAGLEHHGHTVHPELICTVCGEPIEPASVRRIAPDTSTDDIPV